MVTAGADDSGPKAHRPAQSAPVADAGRFVALDSLRGICAVVVAVFHILSSGFITTLPFIRHGWLFVDFFFVLSGFVIAQAYFTRIAEGYSVKTFMFLRLGRVYPLHIAVLAMMVVMQLVLLFIGGFGVSDRVALTGDRSVAALFANVALLQAFGLFDRLTWNGPSWSIAGEVWSYLVFALLVSALGRRAVYVFAALAVALLILLLTNDPVFLNETYRWGFLRCLFGFQLGVLTQMAYHRLQSRLPRGFAATLAEITMCVVCVLAVSLIGEGWQTALVPLLFVPTVLVFACDRGAVSRLLATWLPQWLGLLSYSIYMIHAVIIARCEDALDVVEKLSGITLTRLIDHGHWSRTMISAGPVLTEVIVVAIILLVIGCAWLTYRYIELPAREWSRRKAKAWGPPAAVARRSVRRGS